MILVTVLVQGSTLGPLIRRLGLDGTEAPDPNLLSEEHAWARMAHAQLAVVEAASRQEDGGERHPRLLEQYGYRARVSVRYAANPAAFRDREIEHFTLVREAIRAGRAEALRMHRAGEIHDRVLFALEQELDLQEMTAELSLG